MGRRTQQEWKRLARYAPSGSMPPGTDLDHDPHRASADPTGNRAQRRKAKKLGVKRQGEK